MLLLAHLFSRALLPHGNNGNMWARSCCSRCTARCMRSKWQAAEGGGSAVIALERAGGNRSEAAALLGLNRTTLVEKLRKITP